jgi:sugar phosphate isomerase/epimerase
MVGVHFHDVVGVTDHQIPGYGNVDFKKIAPFIPEGVSKTLEISPHFNLAQIAEGLEVLTESGNISRL